MKKLFLTSGLVLCLACPAFAEDDPIVNNLNYSENQQGVGSYTLDGGGTPSCQYPDTLTDPIQETTFYAVWDAKDFTINYVPGTARNLNYQNSAVHTPVTPQGATTSQTVTYDEETGAILGNMFTAPTGYTFGGWKGNYDEEGHATAYTDADHTGGTSYTVGATIDPYQVDGNLTLTAVWNPKSYSVIYNPNGHALSGQSAASTITRNAAITFDDVYTTETFATVNASGLGWTVAPGYTFEGWGRNANDTNSSANFVGVDVGETDTIGPWTTDDNLTLYAIYSANPYTLSYVCPEYNVGSVHKVAGNGEDDVHEIGTMSYNKVFDGAAAPAKTPAEICSLRGYHPAGSWVCKDTLTEDPVEYSLVASNTEGAKWTYPGSVQCTFEWAPNVVPLSWEPGANAEANTTNAGGENCTYDLGINVAGKPTKAGYEFKGWTTDPSTPGVFLETQPTPPAQQGGGDNNNGGGTGGEEPGSTEPANP